MVRRIARRGEHAGQAFWGCQHFPYCTATRHLDGEIDDYHDPVKAKERIESAKRGPAPRSRVWRGPGERRGRDSTDSVGGYGTARDDQGDWGGGYDGGGGM